jgi:hypothetical protein
MLASPGLDKGNNKHSSLLVVFDGVWNTAMKTFVVESVPHEEYEFNKQKDYFSLQHKISAYLLYKVIRNQYIHCQANECWSLQGSKMPYPQFRNPRSPENRRFLTHATRNADVRRQLFLGTLTRPCCSLILLFFWGVILWFWD